MGFHIFASCWTSRIHLRLCVNQTTKSIAEIKACCMLITENIPLQKNIFHCAFMHWRDLVVWPQNPRSTAPQNQSIYFSTLNIQIDKFYSKVSHLPSTNYQGRRIDVWRRPAIVGRKPSRFKRLDTRHWNKMNITDIKSMYNTEKTYSYQVLALHISGDMC